MVELVTDPMVLLTLRSRCSHQPLPGLSRQTAEVIIEAVQLQVQEEEVAAGTGFGCDRSLYLWWNLNQAGNFQSKVATTTLTSSPVIRALPTPLP